MYHFFMRKLYRFFGLLLGALITATLVLLVVGIVCVQLLVIYKNPCEGIILSVGGRLLSSNPSSEYLWYEHIMPIFGEAIEILIVGIFFISLLYVIWGAVRYLIVRCNSKKATKNMMIRINVLRGCSGIIVSILLFALLSISLSLFPLCF